jgi:signal recognition particle subunit SRP54
MFNSLSDHLESAFKNIKGQARVTELNVAATLKDIRRALVDADVNYKIAKDFTDRVKEKAIGEKVINAISPGQLMVKIVKDELTDLMGGEEAVFNAKGSPAVILIAGLQGSGKTTFSGKLANYLKTKKGLSPILVAADIYRPAAMEQLRVLGEQIGIDVHIELESKDAVSIAQNAIKEARSKNKNVVIIDTAGRLAIDEAMMTEVSNIKNAVNPQEILFVVDSMTGQDAVNTAKAFNDRLNFSGVVLTNSMAIQEVARRFQLNTPLTSLSSLPVQEKRWIRWMFSILKGWLNVFWGWVTSQHLLKKPRNSLMKNRQKNLKRRSAGTSLILPISKCSSSR